MKTNQKEKKRIQKLINKLKNMTIITKKGKVENKVKVEIINK